MRVYLHTHMLFMKDFRLSNFVCVRWIILKIFSHLIRKYEHESAVKMTSPMAVWTNWMKISCHLWVVTYLRWQRCWMLSWKIFFDKKRFSSNLLVQLNLVALVSPQIKAVRFKEEYDWLLCWFSYTPYGVSFSTQKMQWDF